MFIELEKYLNYSYPLLSNDEDAKTTATSSKKRKITKSKENVDQEAMSFDFREIQDTSAGYKDYSFSYIETENFEINQPNDNELDNNQHDINQSHNNPLDNKHSTIGGKRLSLLILNQELD